MENSCDEIEDSVLMDKLDALGLAMMIGNLEAVGYIERFDGPFIFSDGEILATDDVRANQ